MSHDDHTSLAADLCTEKGHFTSGIAVFSSSRKPLYMNAAAKQLLLQLNRTEIGDSAILRSVDNLLDEILLVPRIGSSDPGWKQLATRRFSTVPGRSVLIRTFGIPDRRDSERSLIVFTMRETHES